MKTYTKTTTVGAVQANWIQGIAISETEASKRRPIPGATNQIILNQTFVGQNVIREGDYVLFKGNQPVEVVSQKVFEENYELVEDNPPVVS